MSHPNQSSLAAAMLLAVGVVSALALDARAADAGDAADDAVAWVEEILVEARRRAENLQEVPLSITALTEGALRDLGVDEIKDLSSFSPGLDIEGGVDNNSTRFFVRGVGTATPSIGFEPAVPIYIDDIYTPLGLGGNIDIFSVDRVEVLRGPQGTLYGRNSLGGAVKLYSKEFGDATEGAVSVRVGSYGQRNVKGEFRTPMLEDRLFFGVAYASIQNDGIQDNVYTDTKGWEDDKQLYRIRVEGRPNETLTLRYSYERNDSAGAAKQVRVRPGTQGLIDFKAHVGGAAAYNNALRNAYAAGLDPTAYPLLPAGDVPFVVAANNPFAGDVDNIFSDMIGDNTVDQESHTWSLAWEINDGYSIRYLGAVREQFNTRLFDIDGGPAAYFPGFEEFSFEAESHEFRLEHQSERLNVSAGVFYYEEDSDGLQFFQNPFSIPFATAKIEAATAAGDFSVLTFEPVRLIQDPMGSHTGSNVVRLNNALRQNTESTALYLNVGYEVSEKLRLSFGVRYTEDDKFGETLVGNNNEGAFITVSTDTTPGTGNFTPVGGLGQFFSANGLSADALRNFIGVSGPPPVPPDRFGAISDLQASFDEVTFEVTADYSLTEDSMVYGSFKQGFQGGHLFPIAIPDTVPVLDAQGNVSQTEIGVDPITSPQKINAVEVGFKTTIDGRIQWNAAAYWYDWKDMILFQRFEVTGDQNLLASFSVPANSATATSLGIESELQYIVNEHFAMFANVAYNHFALNSVVRTDAVNGTVEVRDQFVDDWVAASPDFQGTMGLEYFHDLGNLGKLRWWATVAYRDKISANGQASFQKVGLNLLSPRQVDENFYSASHTDIGAGVSFTSLEENWRIDLSASNLLDERRPEAIVNSVQGRFLGTLETWNRPRAWALTLSYDF